MLWSAKTHMSKFREEQGNESTHFVYLIISADGFEMSRQFPYFPAMMSSEYFIALDNYERHL